MSTVRLSKLHATGNDFLVHAGMLSGDDAARLCDRHTGVGADGLLLLLPGDDGADCTMVLYNADGGRAEMSGNGMRCLAWVAAREGFGDGKRLVVDTDGGRRTVDVEFGPGGEVVAATVDMGPATFEPASIPLDAPSAFGLEATFHGVTYDGDAAGMGNPHLVLFVDDPAAARVTSHGPRLEHELDRLRARGVDQEGELVERCLRGFRVAHTDAGADEQRLLLDDAEIGLGRGEAPTAARFGPELVAVLAAAAHGSSNSTSKTCTTGPPRRTVSPSSTARSPPGTFTVTVSPTIPR